MLASMKKEGLAGIIACDLGLITAVRKTIPEIHIHSSVGLTTLNSYAVEFLQSLGIKRIILERSVTIDDMRSIRRLCPNIELEAFPAIDNCCDIDGCCMHHATIIFRPCIVERGYFKKYIPTRKTKVLNRLFELIREKIDFYKVLRDCEDGSQIEKRCAKLLWHIERMESYCRTGKGPR
jgi:hypothetical protein